MKKESLESVIGEVDNHPKLSHDKTLNIYQRLLLCMHDLRYIQKDQTKKVNNQYTFVSHDQVTRAVTDVFLKNGIYGQVEVIKEGTEIIQTKNQPESLVTVQVIIQMTNVDNPDEKVRTNGFGEGQGAKAYGKATSYAYKYAMLKGLGIETGDDPDQEVEEPRVPAKKKEQTFVLDDGVVLTKEGFAGELMEIITNLKTQDDLVDYEEFKGKNKTEIDKFRRLYPQQATQLAEAYKKQLTVIPALGD